MTVGTLNGKWNACLLLMLLQSGIVFFKCFTCLLLSIKVSANTLSKNKQSEHKFLAAALPGTIPKRGWELVPRLAPVLLGSSALSLRTHRALPSHRGVAHR